MKEKIIRAIDDGISALQQLKTAKGLEFIEECAQLIASCFRQGNKLLIAGNGGSLCDAAHFAEELTGLFRKARPALPAIALTDPGHMSCVSNDMGFDQVFSRAIEAYGKEGDCFIGLTTSGKSPNMVTAFERAQDLGLNTIAFLGKGGGQIKGMADLEIVINEFSTSDRIQEAHMTAIHIIIEIVEELLFYQNPEKAFLNEILAKVSSKT